MIKINTSPLILKKLFCFDISINGAIVDVGNDSSFSIESFKYPHQGAFQRSVCLFVQEGMF